jgi:ataxia telangiectasia mutated family protein
MLSTTLLKIPSYKFIVAMPKLVVRLNDKAGDKSNELLKQLLERCCFIDHPYRALPLVLALVCSNADSPDPTAHPDPRVTGAKKFWRAFKGHSQDSFPTMQQLDNAPLALIDLASKESSKIPSNHQLALLKTLNFVQCPTIEIPLMKDGNYKNCVTSAIQWSWEIVNVGGSNAPIKIKCVCSDGITRPPLLKGKDDMRQDAVM